MCVCRILSLLKRINIEFQFGDYESTRDWLLEGERELWLYLVNASLSSPNQIAFLLLPFNFLTHNLVLIIVFRLNSDVYLHLSKLANLSLSTSHFCCVCVISIRVICSKFRSEIVPFVCLQPHHLVSLPVEFAFHFFVFHCFKTNTNLLSLHFQIIHFCRTKCVPLFSSTSL